MKEEAKRNRKVETLETLIKEKKAKT